MARNGNHAPLPIAATDCRHCNRIIEMRSEGWASPDADGSDDDPYNCEDNESFVAIHEPDATAGFSAEIAHEPTMPTPAGFDAKARAYHVKLTYDPTGQSMTFPYYCGSACGEPTLANVLMTIASDAGLGALDYGDFCDSLGMNEDSRRNFSTWETCQNYNRELRRIAGDDVAVRVMRASEDY